jgi:Flp pilus assembly protein TadG
MRLRRLHRLMRPPCWGDRPRARAVHDERGAAAVEFAIVASIFFLLVFGIIDFGFGFHTWNGTANAAREGARRAAVDPNVTSIVSRARSAVSYLDPTKLTVAVTCSRGSASFTPCPASASWLEGDLVRVTVDYNYGFITPVGTMVGMGSGLTLHSVSESRFEG